MRQRGRLLAHVSRVRGAWTALTRPAVGLPLTAFQHAKPYVGERGSIPILYRLALLKKILQLSVT